MEKEIIKFNNENCVSEIAENIEIAEITEKTEMAGNTEIISIDTAKKFECTEKGMIPVLLEEVFRNYSGNGETLTFEQIINYLRDDYKMNIERKSLGKYLVTLSDSGLGIEKIGRSYRFNPDNVWIDIYEDPVRGFFGETCPYSFDEEKSSLN